MFERFRWGLTSGERYSTGRLTPQKRGIHCACQHFVSERVGVLAEYGGVVVRLPLGLRSLTLLRCLSRHSSLVLCSCLTLQAMAPKAYLTGKSKDKVAAKKTRKKPGGPRLRRCWAELRGWSFTRSCFWGWTLAQNQASLDWASSVVCMLVAFFCLMRLGQLIAVFTANWCKVKQVKTLSCGTAGRRLKVIHGCHSQWKGRGRLPQKMVLAVVQHCLHAMHVAFVQLFFLETCCAKYAAEGELDAYGFAL